jgi:hypothetical protein
LALQTLREGDNPPDLIGNGTHTAFDETQDVQIKVWLKADGSVEVRFHDEETTLGGILEASRRKMVGSVKQGSGSDEDEAEPNDSDECPSCDQPLETFRTPHSYHSCDRCGESIREGATIQRCDDCDFDMCSDCSDSGGGDGAFDLSLAKLLCCPKKHRMKPEDYDRGWGCDTCECDGERGQTRFRCVQCDYDLCDDCAEEALEQDSSGGGRSSGGRSGGSSGGSRLTAGDKVQMAAGADGGCLAGGAIGLITQDDRSDQPYLVECDGNTYWYRENQVVRAGSVDTPSYVCVGVTSPELSGMTVHDLPGEVRGSVGFRSDGALLRSRERPRYPHFGPPLKGGDTVGCGLVHATGELFFTLNGSKMTDTSGAPAGSPEWTFGKRFVPSLGFNGLAQVKVRFGWHGDNAFKYKPWAQLPRNSNGPMLLGLFPGCRARFFCGGPLKGPLAGGAGAACCGGGRPGASEAETQPPLQCIDCSASKVFNLSGAKNPVRPGKDDQADTLFCDRKLPGGKCGETGLQCQSCIDLVAACTRRPCPSGHQMKISTAGGTCQMRLRGIRHLEVLEENCIECENFCEQRVPSGSSAWFCEACSYWMCETCSTARVVRTSVHEKRDEDEDEDEDEGAQKARLVQKDRFEQQRAALTKRFNRMVLPRFAGAKAADGAKALAEFIIRWADENLDDGQSQAALMALTMRPALLRQLWGQLLVEFKQDGDVKSKMKIWFGDSLSDSLGEIGHDEGEDDDERDEAGEEDEDWADPAGEDGDGFLKCLSDPAHRLRYSNYAGGGSQGGWCCDMCEESYPPENFKWHCVTTDFCEPCGSILAERQEVEIHADHTCRSSGMHPVIGPCWEEPKAASSLKNKSGKGDSVRFGTADGSRAQFYCGKKKKSAKSDDKTTCGPSGGPQCDDCSAFKPTNRAGASMSAAKAEEWKEGTGRTSATR